MLNSANVQGRIVAEPELRHTANGIAVCSFTIANDQGSGDKKKTSFIDIVCWRTTSEFVCKYFQKGSAIIVQGTIQTRSYTDKDNNKRKAFEIVADNVHFAESKRDGVGAQGSFHSKTDTTNDQPVPAYASGDTGDFEEMPSDDDLPF